MKWNSIGGTCVLLLAALAVAREVQSYINLCNKELANHTREANAAVLANPAGACSIEQFQATDRSRLRKSAGFIRETAVKMKATACSLTLKPVVELLSHHFTAARLDDKGLSMLQWLGGESPVLHAIDRLITLLANPHDKHWHLFSEWPHDTERLATTCHA